MVYPEVAPFVQTGDIAEVGSELPRALKEMGHDVRLITPQYRSINERKYILRDVIRLQNITVPLGERQVKINVKSAFMPDSRVQVYFIAYNPYFHRKGIYRHPESGELYDDNDKRFILFSRGVLETLKKLQWQPDVIHCNGWQSGLVPLFLKLSYLDDSFFKDIACLFTIFDADEAGRFSPECIHSMSLGESGAEAEKLVCNDSFSFLHAGIAYSDRINAVSRAFTDMAGSDEGEACGLAGLLKKSDGKCTVIVPGAVSDTWNPETDKFITAGFSSENPADKYVNKTSLIETLKLTAEPDKPLMLVLQENSNDDLLRLILDTADKLLKEGLVLVFILSNDSYKEALQKLEIEHKGSIAVISYRNLELVHSAFAGADALLSHTDYPETGLSVRRGMAYGVIPVLHIAARKDGAAAAVIPELQESGSFMFHHLQADALLKAVKEALKVVLNQEMRETLIQQYMIAASAWKTAAEAYVGEYYRCTDKS